VEVRSNDFDVRRQINGGDNNEIRVSILGCWSENDGEIVSTAGDRQGQRGNRRRQRTKRWAKMT
jgi:hypothetical protein